jgi:signal peptidase I
MNEDITPPERLPAPGQSVTPLEPTSPVDPTPNPKPLATYTPLPKSGRGEGKPKGNGGSGWHELLSTLGILAAAFGVALLIIFFVFRSYQVDGPSMESTLQNSDKLIIWKVPRTWASLTGHPYIPKRGDIVVFTETGLSQFGQQDSKQLIKRVIGLPGDHIKVTNGAITIYNAAHLNGFMPDKTLPYGKHIPVTSGNVDVTLDKDQLFVSGDNRPDSLDSRSFGPIRAKQIVGKLVLRVFPISKAQTF